METDEILISGQNGRTKWKDIRSKPDKMAPTPNADF